MIEGDVRARIISAIRDFAERLQVAHASPPAAGGDAKPQALLREACARVGIDELTYKTALEDDASLAELERTAMSEAIAGTSDPGPHDAISRESMSGKPGDLSKPRSEAVRHKMYS